MKRRSLIGALALLLALPFGLGVVAGHASAACYVDRSSGGLEKAPSFQDEYSCRTAAGGYWY